MKTGGIGRLIGELRKETKISQKRLCKGLCSVQLLSKIELEERIPDMLLLEALMQRLGKSPEKLEIILSLEEYQHIEARDEIEDALRFGKLEEAEEKLNAYLKKYEYEGIMQRMYGYRMRGALAIERKEYVDAEKYLREAVTMSVPEQNWLQLKEELLSTFELENMVLLCQAWFKQERLEEAKALLEVLNQYVKEHITDNEELVKIQSKVASILGALYNHIGAYQACIELCEPALERERNSFLLQGMILLMSNLLLAYERVGESEKCEKVIKWKASLECLYKMQGWSCDIVNGMYFNFYARQYYLDCELIRGERIRKGFTQEELAEGIYECVESLSRVENGKDRPNRVKFAQLMEKLGLEKSRYNGHLSVLDYQALESDYKIEQLMTRRCYDAAKEELEHLEQLLDLSEIQNAQLIERRKNVFAGEKQELTRQEMKAKSETLLSYTYDFEHLTRVPFRNETYLYNDICLQLWGLDKKEESVKERQKLVECFLSSRIHTKYHLRSIGIVMLNMTDEMERMGYLEDAEYWTRWEMRELLSCGKGSRLEHFLSTLVCVLEKRNENREISLELTKHTIWLSELFKQEQFFKVAKEYLYKNYKETVG